MKETHGWLATYAAIGMSTLLQSPAVRAQTVEPVDALTVVDATGTKVGNALGDLFLGLRADVALLINGGLFLATVSEDGFRFTCGFSSESTDCSGTKYTQSAGLLKDCVIAPPGNTAYIIDRTVSGRTITVQSNYQSDPQDPQGPAICVPADPSYTLENAVPLKSVVDLNTKFTPPFHAVPSTSLSPQCCGDCNGNGRVSVDEVLTSVNKTLTSCGTSSTTAAAR